jgi:hypothetical protein
MLEDLGQKKKIVKTENVEKKKKKKKKVKETEGEPKIRSKL